MTNADRITDLESQLQATQRALVAPTTLTAAAHILRACAEHMQSLSVGYGADQMRAIAARLDAGYAEGYSYLLAESEARYKAQRSAAALRKALEEMLDASCDPNATNGEFDTTAGRARRLLAAGTETP